MIKQDGFKTNFKIAVRTGFETRFLFSLHLMKNFMVITSVKAQTTKYYLKIVNLVAKSLKKLKKFASIFSKVLIMHPLHTILINRT